MYSNTKANCFKSAPLLANLQHGSTKIDLAEVAVRVYLAPSLPTF